MQAIDGAVHSRQARALVSRLLCVNMVLLVLTGNNRNEDISVE